MTPFWGYFSDIENNYYTVVVGGKNNVGIASMDDMSIEYVSQHSFEPITDEQYTGDRYIYYDSAYRRLDRFYVDDNSLFEYTSKDDPLSGYDNKNIVHVDCQIPQGETHTITKFGRTFANVVVGQYISDTHKYQYRHAMECEELDGRMILTIPYAGVLRMAFSVNQTSTTLTTCIYNIHDSALNTDTEFDAATPFINRVNVGGTYIYPYTEYIVQQPTTLTITNTTLKSREVTLPFYGFTFLCLDDVDLATQYVSNLHYRIVLDGVEMDYNRNLHDNPTVYYKRKDMTAIEWGESPCVIETKSSNLFAPIKSRSCTLSFVTDDIIDAYAASTMDVEVNVYRGKAQFTDCIFHGYLTPCMYSQNYANKYEEIELEAVDAISALDSIAYDKVELTAIKSYKRMIDIMKKLLFYVGYKRIFVPKAKSTSLHFNAAADTMIPIARVSPLDPIDPPFDPSVPLIPQWFLKNVTYSLAHSIKVNEANFFDDDDEHTAWSCKEVLEEMMKYCGWSMIPMGNDVYCVDYQTMATSTDYDCIVVNYDGTEEEQSLEMIHGLQRQHYRNTDQSLSIDDVYNKIEVNVNTYVPDDLSPDVLDVENWYSITQNEGMNSNGHTWYNNGRVLGYSHQTFGRLNYSTNWSHDFYKMSDGSHIIGYTDTTSTSVYNLNAFGLSGRNPINARGAYLERYAFRNYSGNTKPAKLSWENVICFHELDDTCTYPSLLNMIGQFINEPVLHYFDYTSMIYSPLTGTSWICINAELYYQFTTRTFSNITTSTHEYDMSPSPNNVTSTEAFTWWANKHQIIKNNGYGGDTYEWTQTGNDAQKCSTRTTDNPYYGKGWELLFCQLKVGNKYWNGSEWSETASSFFIPFNNTPKDGADEKCLAFEWLKVAANTTYEDGIDEGGYNIPITPNDKLSGTLDLKIFPPFQYPVDVAVQLDTYRGMQQGFVNPDDSWNYHYRWGVGDLNITTSTTNVELASNPTYYHLAPCVWMKNFEIKYKYADSTVWYMRNDDEKEDKDIIYTNIINETYQDDFDGVELKINTLCEEQKVSKSAVSDGERYVKDIIIGNVEQTQEEFLVDKYYNHYSTPKFIYDCTINVFYPPYTVIYPAPNDAWYDKQKEIETHRFCMDSCTWDLKQKTNKMHLVEY